MMEDETHHRFLDRVGARRKSVLGETGITSATVTESDLCEPQHTAIVSLPSDTHAGAKSRVCKCSRFDVIRLRSVWGASLLPCRTATMTIRASPLTSDEHVRDEEIGETEITLRDDRED